MISYDYEPIYALGSMLGVSDARGFLRLMEQVEIFGLDAISTGVVLAWATEAQESGIISDKETMGLKFSWGDYYTYMHAVQLITRQPNAFYKALARGVEYASSLYGGEDYALAFSGNEMPGYHTGPATHIGVLIGTRHSHLDNAGYSLDQKVSIREKISSEELAKTLLNEERWRQILSSLVICFFARGIYQPDTVSKTLKLAGFDLSEADLSNLGKEIHTNKYRFKMREGFKLDSLRMPKRIFETRTPAGELNEKLLLEVVEHFNNQMESCK